jgi:hypothetical protein
VWFVVLAALPFTAPFATLDMADLLGRAHTSTAVATVSASAACTPQPDDSIDDVVAPYANGRRVLPTARVVLTSMRSAVASRPTPPTVTLASSIGSAPPPTRGISVLAVTLRL